MKTFQLKNGVYWTFSPYLCVLWPAFCIFRRHCLTGVGSLGEDIVHHTRILGEKPHSEIIGAENAEGRVAGSEFRDLILGFPDIFSIALLAIGR